MITIHNTATGAHLHTRHGDDLDTALDEMAVDRGWPSWADWLASDTAPAGELGILLADGTELFRTVAEIERDEAARLDRLEQARWRTAAADAGGATCERTTDR